MVVGMVVPWILTNTVENESIHMHQMKKGVENMHTRKPSTSFLRFGLALPCHAITRSLENEFAVVSWSCFYPKKRFCQSLAKKIRRTAFSEKRRTCRHRGCTCDSTDPRVPNLPYIHNSPRNPNSTGFGTTPEMVSEVRAMPPMAEMSSHLRR